MTRTTEAQKRIAVLEETAGQLTELQESLGAMGEPVVAALIRQAVAFIAIRVASTRVWGNV